MVFVLSQQIKYFHLMSFKFLKYWAKSEFQPIGKREKVSVVYVCFQIHFLIDHHSKEGKHIPNMKIVENPLLVMLDCTFTMY